MITIYIKLKETEQPLPYGYEHVFHGYISDLLGNETYGERVNKYSYSNICGGIPTKNGITFKSCPYFIIRTDDWQTWQNFLTNIKRKKNIMQNMIVEGFYVKNFDLNRNKFYTMPSSPILVSKKYDKINYLNAKELKECEAYLTNSVLQKAKDCGFEVDPHLQIKICDQRNHVDVFYRGIINKGRNLILNIEADNATKQFIIINGLGRSCGCGFGVIY